MNLQKNRKESLRKHVHLNYARRKEGYLKVRGFTVESFVTTTFYYKLQKVHLARRHFFASTKLVLLLLLYVDMRCVCIYMYIMTLIDDITYCLSNKEPTGNLETRFS